MTLTIAGMRVPLESAVESIKNYPEATVKYYDLGGVGKCQPSDGVSLEDLGRLTFINPDLSGDDAANLIKAGRNANWGLVGWDERLEEADPEEDGGLWDRADTLYKYFKGPGIKTAKVSKLLHIKRPFFFPVLDAYVCYIYRGAAEQAAMESRRQAKALYWEAIRRDLQANTKALKKLRGQLEQVAYLEPFLALPDLRLVDILAWRRAKKEVKDPKPC